MHLVHDLILLLLNEDTGYFHQVPGWNLNCAIAGGCLADLALSGHIDTDLDHLFVTKRDKIKVPYLNKILEEINAEPDKKNTQYWIERLSTHSEEVMVASLSDLRDEEILIEHSGGFWSLAQGTWQVEAYSMPSEIPSEFVKTRIAKVLLGGEIPHPKDAILVALAKSCNVLQYIFPATDEIAERIDVICNLDVIGRSVGEATAKSIAQPRFHRALNTKPIPLAPLRDLLFNPLLRGGNIPALFADVAIKHGPVFRLNVPFQKEKMLFLAGPGPNRWMHQVGRSYVRSKDYLSEFEEVYGASRILPSMDGADHFRMRKAIYATYSRAALADRLDELYYFARKHLATWKPGDILYAVNDLKKFSNAQFSHLSVGVDTQREFENLVEFKERSLTTHVQRTLPKFMLETPGMKRRKKLIGNLVNRIQAAHTPAQRVGKPHDIVDDILGLHAADPQFLPETDLVFSLISPLIVSLYMGNALAFALYNLLRHPELYRQIQAEADRIFAKDDPDKEAVSKSELDLTYRFFMESQRLYPIIPIQIRTVMNSCVIEGYEIPLGSKIHLVQTATHYMDDIFPDPFTFDIDRHRTEGDSSYHVLNYAPFGLGTHKCLGFQWVELHLAINLLMLVHYFDFELSPSNYQLRINPFPTMCPTKKMKLRITEQRHPLRPQESRPAFAALKHAEPTACPVSAAKSA